MWEIICESKFTCIFGNHKSRVSKQIPANVVDNIKFESYNDHKGCPVGGVLKYIFPQGKTHLELTDMNPFVVVTVFNVYVIYGVL